MGMFGWRSWLRQTWSTPVKQRSARIAVRRFRLVLEALEDRCTPSTVFVNASATGANTGTSWADAFTSLPSGLAAAQPGDQVWVAQGTYRPTATADRAVSFALRDGVGVYGGFAGTETDLAQRDLGQNPTTLSGDIGTPGDNADNSYHVVTANNLTSAVFDGFTITAGNANGSSQLGQYRGGGLRVEPSVAGLTLSNLVFQSNRASEGGGVSTGGRVTLVNVSFRDNTAYSGGGMSAGGTATLTNVTFTGNSATIGNGNGGGLANYGTTMLSQFLFANNSAPNGKGGGVSAFSGRLTLANGAITGNTAARGGGVYVNFDAAGTSLAAVTITNNSSTQGAGGLLNDTFGQRPGQVALADVLFQSNTGERAGGMENFGGTAFLTNVTFSNNVSRTTGGGLNNSGRATLTNVVFFANSASGAAMANSLGMNAVSATLTNVTFTRNASRGFYNEPPTHFFRAPVATLTNCILWGDAGPESSVTNVTIRYSIVQGGFAGVGNLDADPRFLDPANGDLRLRVGSPAIDTGTNDGAFSYDRDGSPRPVDGNRDGTTAFDMGAYEFQVLPLVAVGTQEGVPAYVALYNAVGQRYTLQPYGDSFFGGVRVAVADFDQDGVDDLVTAPGPGGAPTVKVYSGRSGALLASFDAYGPFTGGVFVAAADVLGRGTPQVVTGPGEGGEPIVHVWDVGNGPQLAVSLPVFAAGFTGGVTVGASNGVLVAGAASQGMAVRVFDQSGLSRSRVFEPFGQPFADGVTVATNGQYLAVGQRAGTSLVNLFHLSDLSLAATLVPEFGIPHDPAYPGGTSVGWTREADGTWNLLTGTGPGWPAAVQYWVAGTWQRRTGFSDFGGYPGGVWVA